MDYILKRNYSTTKAKWFIDPRQYLYVRESQAESYSPKYLPIKKKDFTYLVYTDTEGKTVTKKTPLYLVGIEEPKKHGKIYKFTYWWLKGYDAGCKDNNVKVSITEMPNYGWVTYKGNKFVFAPAEAVTFKTNFTD